MFSKPLGFRRSVWIGAGIGIGFSCAMLGIAAKLIVSGVLRPDLELPAVCISLFLGAVFGGMTAAGRKREVRYSIWCAGVIYGSMWIAAFAFGRHICFDGTAIAEMICVFCGCILGGLMRPEHRKSDHRRKGGKRRKRGLSGPAAKMT